MPIIFSLLLVISLVSSACADSYHWVDADGFHSVDQVTKVPLEHRRDLPMVKNHSSLPFTADEDRDGAMFIWFIFSQKGIDYPFTRTDDIPRSRVFREVQAPERPDIAWWKGFVAIYRSETGTLLTARGETSLKAEEKRRGKAVWYRYTGPSSRIAPQPAKKAPLKKIMAANDTLRGLDKAATFPPQVKDAAERDILQGSWEKAQAGLEALRRQYPDDPQVLRLLGVYYRMGFDLGVAGAWDRSEAYLLRTEELAPEAPEAFISLGILYGDTTPDYAQQAELQFRLALHHARKEQMPQIWWGLSVALHSQRKSAEALRAIDQLIALRPDDKKAKEMRDLLLKAGQEEKK